MEKIFADFGVQPLLLTAQIVNFLILLVLLKKFLYKPLLKVLEERKQKIADSLKNAEEIEKKLLKTEEDREKVLAKASNEAQKIVEEATKSAQQIIADAHTKAASDMEVIFKKGQEAVRQEKEKMQQEIREELADLVTISLEKVTGKILNKKDQKDLVEGAVKNIS